MGRHDFFTQHCFPLAPVLALILFILQRMGGREEAMTTPNDVDEFRVKRRKVDKNLMESRNCKDVGGSEDLDGESERGQDEGGQSESEESQGENERGENEIECNGNRSE